MEISKDISILDVALYLHNQNSLVFGDVHIGYEAALNKRGVLLPRFHFKDTVARLEKIFAELKPLLKKLNKGKLNNIIVNGDLKHEFGFISEQEWRDTLKFLDLLSLHCKKIVLIRGNHDIVLGPIARKRNIKVVEDFTADGIFICHGHKIPQTLEFKNAKTIIIGNEHPAVTIRDTTRAEIFKCFLKGSFKGKKMIVMPSFNPITIGTDVLKAKFISPFLKQNISNFEVFVAADKTYYFGRVKNLAR